MSLRKAIAAALWRRPQNAAGARTPTPRRCPLKDGIRFDGRIIHHLDFRPFNGSDILPLATMNPDSLGSVLQTVARLTDEPFEALQVMTQDDAIAVLARLDELMREFNQQLQEGLEAHGYPAEHTPPLTP